MLFIVTEDRLFEHLEIQQSCRIYFEFLAFIHIFPAPVDKVLLWIHVNACAEGVDRECSEHGNGQNAVIRTYQSLFTVFAGLNLS